MREAGRINPRLKRTDLKSSNTRLVEMCIYSVLITSIRLLYVMFIEFSACKCLVLVRPPDLNKNANLYIFF